MAKIVGKTLVALKPFEFSLEDEMLKKSLTQHFLEQRSIRSYPGHLDQAVIVNARYPEVDCMRGRDVEGPSRSDRCFDLNSSYPLSA